jgi:hypothetical protein
MGGRGVTHDPTPDRFIFHVVYWVCLFVCLFVVSEPQAFTLEDAGRARLIKIMESWLMTLAALSAAAVVCGGSARLREGTTPTVFVTNIRASKTGQTQNPLPPPPEWQRNDISHLPSNGGWGGSLADTKQSWPGQPRQRRNDPRLFEFAANRAAEVALLKGTKEPLAQWLWVSFRSATF